MAVAGLAYVAALIVLDRGRVSGRLAWPLVIGVATIVRLALFFMPALLSSDIIDYATHGRVASLHGANPYIQTPSQFPSDPLSSLGAWPTVVTVYGPLWTHVDAAITGLLPNASLVQLVFAYKLVGLAADVASVCLLFWLVRRWRGLGATAVTPLVAVAMWLWNPLVNVELIGNAHNESLMIALVLLGMAVVTEAAVRPSRTWLWLAALLTLWLGALVKFVPLALEAVVALVWLRTGFGISSPLAPTEIAPARPRTWAHWPFTPGFAAPAHPARNDVAAVRPAPTDVAPVRLRTWFPWPFTRGVAGVARPAPKRPRRTWSDAVWRLPLLVALLAAVTLLVAMPWLDSPAVAAPVVGLASGGQRFKDVWQDAPAAWLTVRVVPLLGVPDDPATLRMDVARVLVYSVTRILFAAYVVAEAWHLWRAARGLSTLAPSAQPPDAGTDSLPRHIASNPTQARPELVADPGALSRDTVPNPGDAQPEFAPDPGAALQAISSDPCGAQREFAGSVLRAITLASMRVLLLALLLYTSQVYAWYFLWPLPMACLLGPRNGWSRATVVFGLVFLPAYYLREFAPYGVFEMPRYAELGVAILAAGWLGSRLLGRPELRTAPPARQAAEPTEAVSP